MKHLRSSLKQSKINHPLNIVSRIPHTRYQDEQNPVHMHPNHMNIKSHDAVSLIFRNLEDKHHIISPQKERNRDYPACDNVSPTHKTVSSDPPRAHHTQKQNKKN